MRRSIYRLSKVAEEGARGRSGVQSGAQSDETNEGISLTLRFLQAEQRREKESRTQLRAGALRAACRQALRVRRATMMTARQVSNEVRLSATLRMRARARSAAVAR